MPARALLPVLLLCVLLRQAEGGFRGQRRTQSRWNTATHRHQGVREAHQHIHVQTQV
ncbi:Er Degradation-Enhancing Alpha-Mannosidase-Like Protein 2 [Manis pentadactyla]|nr:Er Degradation-Enhancing Alpha-Mannosidase-Like Protein 2 [Manis pentadactyla]